MVDEEALVRYIEPTLPRANNQMYFIDDYPTHGPLSSMFDPKHNIILEIAREKCLLTRYCNDVYAFIPTLGHWRNLKSSDGLRWLATTLGMDNVTVNYGPAVDGYLKFAEMVSVAAYSIPVPSVCIGTWRIRVGLHSSNTTILPQIVALTTDLTTNPEYNSDEDAPRSIITNELGISQAEMQSGAYESLILEKWLEFMEDLTMTMIQTAPITGIVPTPAQNWVSMRIGSLVLEPVLSNLIPYGALKYETSIIEKTMLNSMDPLSLKVLMWCLGNAIVDPVARPRVLYLYGHGGEGKSSAINAILNAFAGCAKALSHDYVGSNREIDPSDAEILLNNRIVAYGDVALKDGVVNERFWKLVTGGDMVSLGKITGRINSTLLLGGNEMWYPPRSMMKTWFTRRTIVISMKKKLLPGVLPKSTYSEEDRMQFVMRCVIMRLLHTSAPISTRMAFITVFGTKCKIYTRGIAFSEPANIIESMAAMYSISFLSGIKVEELIRIFEAMSPNIIGSECGYKFIKGICVV